MKLRITALALALLCLLGLAACGSGPKAASESTIREDVIGWDEVIYSSDLELVSLEIVKRQTNEDQKTDFVWVDIVAENEDCRYIASCKLSYGLYNDGWLLDSYEVLEDSMEYLNGPDPNAVLARANELMDQYYANFSSRNKGTVELVGLSVNGDRCVALIDHAEQMGQSGLLTIHWRFNLILSLDEQGWTRGAWDGTMRDYAYDWDLVGEWTGSCGGEDFRMQVHSYDPDQKSVEVEYVFGSRRSDGVETMYIVNQDFWDQEMKEWSLSDDASAHHGFIELLPFGASYKDAGEGEGIIADSGENHCWLKRTN